MNPVLKGESVMDDLKTAKILNYYIETVYEKRE
jgi:hypothetical protein